MLPEILSIILVALAIVLLFKPNKKSLYVGIIVVLSTVMGMLILSLVRNFDPLRNLLYVSGYLTFFFLAATLLIGPMLRVFKKPIFTKLLAYRRDLGVATFILALIHTLLTFSKSFSWNFDFFYAHLANSGPIGISIIAAIGATIFLLIIVSPTQS